MKERIKFRQLLQELEKELAQYIEVEKVSNENFQNVLGVYVKAYAAIRATKLDRQTRMQCYNICIEIKEYFIENDVQRKSYYEIDLMNLLLYGTKELNLNQEETKNKIRQLYLDDLEENQATLYSIDVQDFTIEELRIVNHLIRKFNIVIQHFRLEEFNNEHNQKLMDLLKDKPAFFYPLKNI